MFLPHLHHKLIRTTNRHSFLSLVGLLGQAEENLKEVLIEKLKWYGPEHIVVAGVLHYLADLYAVLEAQGL